MKLANLSKQEQEKIGHLMINANRESCLLIDEGYSIEQIYGDLGINLGKWGLAWANWMKDNHPVRTVELMNAMTFDEIAIRINQEAEEFLETLENNWRAKHPRPTDGSYPELLKYETSVRMYAENYLTMEEPERIYHVE